jgi:uncharacterized protein YkwD
MYNGKAVRPSFAFILLLVAAPVLGSPASAPAPPTTTQACMSDDPAVWRGAVESLWAAGETEIAQLIDVLRDRLTADKARVERAAAAIGDGARLRDLERQIDQWRNAARENLSKLARDHTLKLAAEHRARLAGLATQASALYAHRSDIVDAMVRREELREWWRKVASPSDALFSGAPEDALMRLATGALGESPAAAARRCAFGDGRAPASPATSGFWLHRACRQIESYNQSMAGCMNKRENEALRQINGYRQLLGRLPMEIDPRLVQSARRHSREMAQLKYFAHESPTAGLKTPMHRMAAAGYGGMGFSENIALQVRDPKMLVDLWLGSPPHHLAMIDANCTAAGVGKWDDQWTLNMGMGARLMAGAPQERQRAIVRGEVLAAQDESVDLAKPPRTTIIERRIYDPFNPDPTKRRIVEREERK